ncbi:MAG: DUF2341 domain-containing protein, partial [Bacteroidetes bacterium]|nr:DUF2341 domain-containing protein [Bacteroidota bacterium]
MKNFYFPSSFSNILAVLFSSEIKKPTTIKTTLNPIHMKSVTLPTATTVYHTTGAPVYIFVLISIAFLLSLGIPNHSFSQSWYDATWHYRKSHTINSATGAGTNYQVMITVHYSAGADAAGNVYCNSKCKTDFGDIRFTASDGSTLLSYWMQSSVASNNAVFWVKVSADLGSAQSIYIYYGNSTATTTSSGTNTFINYDDGSSTTGWTISGTAGMSSTQGDPINSLYAQTHAAVGGQNYMYKNIGTAGFGTNTFTSFNVYTETGNLGNFYYRCNPTGVGQMYRIDTRTSSYTGFAMTHGWNKWEAPTGTTVSTAGTWYRFGIAITSTTSSTLYYDLTNNSNPVLVTVLGTYTLNDTIGTYIALGGDALGGTVNTYWDNIITRKYVSPEPANSSWGIEEASYVWTHTTSTDWQIGTNWNPTRSSPATTDILQFNLGGSLPAINVPTQIIAQLLLSNSSTVNLTAAAAGNILTVNNVLTTTANDVLNLGSGIILGGTLTTLTNNGKIQTSVPTATSATPIPASKTWGGTVEYNGSGAQTAVGGTYYNLTLSNAAGAVLGIGQTINGTLTLSSGKITLGNYNLTLNTTNAIAGSPGSSNYIVYSGTGRLVKNIPGTMGSDYLFPIGTASNYSPATFRLVSGTVSGASLTINLTEGKQSNIPVSAPNYINRYWTYTPGGTFTTANYNATFTYLQGDVIGTNEGAIVSAKYGTSWTQYTATDVTNNLLTINGATSFSDYTGYGDLAVAPAASPNPICSGSSTTVSANATGGNGSYSYSWIPSQGNVASFNASPTATTAYSVTVTDGLGATVTGSVEVTVNELPTIEAGPDQTVCEDVTDVTMAGYDYDGATGADWSGGAGTWADDVYTPAAADIAAGSVVLTYTTNTAAPCGEV